MEETSYVDVYEGVHIDLVRAEGDYFFVSFHNDGGPQTVRIERSSVTWSFLRLMKRWQRNNIPVTFEVSEGCLRELYSHSGKTASDDALDDFQQIVDGASALLTDLGRMLLIEPWTDFRNRALNRFLDVNQTSM